MAYWLVKSESGNYSIGDLERDRVTFWGGVRNYQARNFLRQMKKGEQVLFYHSVTEPVGVVGICRVKKEAYPDPTQFDSKSQYFDAAASPEEPRWFCPDVEFVERFAQVLPLTDIRTLRGLADMELLRRGSRLSVQVASLKHFEIIVDAARKM